MLRPEDSKCMFITKKESCECVPGAIRANPNIRFGITKASFFPSSALQRTADCTRPCLSTPDIARANLACVYKAQTTLAWAPSALSSSTSSVVDAALKRPTSGVLGKLQIPTYEVAD